MPRLYDIDDKVETDGRSCGAVRDDFRYCVMHSDCVTKDKIKPSECVKNNLIPDECQNLKTLLFECKRSLVSIYKYRRRILYLFFLLNRH